MGSKACKPQCRLQRCQSPGLTLPALQEGATKPTSQQHGDSQVSGLVLAQELLNVRRSPGAHCCRAMPCMHTDAAWCTLHHLAADICPLS